jgi:hypothetical protein
MAVTETWVHGNALVVEAPNSADEIIHLGDGTLLSIRSGTQPWFHIPMSTPAMINGSQTQLARVYILFETNPGDGFITSVWVYDGETLIQQFNNLFLEGVHRASKDSSNTFDLPAPRNVTFGMGISFQFSASTPIDGPEELYRVFIVSAGADFNT